MAFFKREQVSLPQPRIHFFPPSNINNQIKQFTHGILLLALLAGLFALPVTPAHASGTEWVVNKSADTNDGTCDSDCSLREAITAASNGDTITIHSSISSITLEDALEQLYINKNITINGVGMYALNINAQPTAGTDSRVFYIESGAEVTLTGMAIREGDVTSGNGGGIYNAGTLTLQNARILVNEAAGFGGGIHNSGNLTIQNSIISQNTSDYGGGIYNTGSLSIENSLVLTNEAGQQGGGVFSEGNLTITDSNVAFNHANYGGGITFKDTPENGTVLHIERSSLVENEANIDGGGLYLSSENATHTLKNVTFSDNIASEYGGAYFTDTNSDNVETSLVKLINTTFANSSVTGTKSGLFTDYARLELVNNIFSAPAGKDACGDNGHVTITSLGSNIASDASCTFLTDPTDMTETNPRLQSRPAGTGIQTHPISLRSPALDNGNAAHCPDKDGRNASRPVDGDGDGDSRCDIGAYEHTPNIRYVATTGNDSSNNCLNPAAPCATVAEAIAQSANGDHIHIAAGTYTGGYSPNHSLLLKGAGAADTILDGGSSVRVLHVFGGYKMILRGITVQNGYTIAQGGGVLVNGFLETEDVRILNNRAGNDGGGVYVNLGGILAMRNTLIANNEAISGNGGGVFTSGQYNLENVTINGNSATTEWQHSGGLHSQPEVGGNRLVNVTISENSATYGAGATFTSYGIVDVMNSLFFLNSGTQGIAAYADVAFTNSIIAENTCYDDGGRITSGGHNIESGDTCGFGEASDKPNEDAKIYPLGDYGGPVPVHGITITSPAVDAGDNIACPATDARGVARPQDGDNDSNANCDIGPFELEYNVAEPNVTSITRANANPSAAASVTFNVVFDMPVTGVLVNDFELTTTGFTTAPTITAVHGGGMVYSVTVNTGSGNGTIRLDLKPGATINNLSSVAMTALPYTDGETYEINKVMTFTSAGPQDGWVLETDEFSNKGGAINKNGKVFNIGDDALNRQYRAILSFNTSTVPANAVITKVTLRVRRSGTPVGGGNPINTFGGFMVDVKKGNFGTSALQSSDFQTKGNKTISGLKPPLSGGWYNLNITSAKAQVNKTGNTQIRLRFKLDDNNNSIANFLKLHSGNAAQASRPQLIVEFYTP